MMVQISSDLLQHLHAVAAASPAEEVCGLLLGHANRIDAVQIARNIAASPATHFEVDPLCLIAAHKAARAGGAQVIGNWHSHPQGRPEPSAEDARCAAPDGQVWLILGQGSAQCWQAVPNGSWRGRFEQVGLAVV
jgi:proteasome lid subunit RPN8/RPN11